ncbi:MAG TPA: TonB-dependent receptor [Methylomirabilota bacterium]|nr:TonB-dependent receptor [Methylomirabilota bacterium]
MVRTLVVVLLMWSAAAPAAAQEPKKVEPIVVTATKLETPAGELGATVTVIDGDEFEAFHYPTVDEALRSVPGVEIRRSGSFGKTTSVSIRGANANQVQVLVDGVRVKSPTLGQAELADIAPDMIERIEIIRGPQSTIYGADAIGGVVHVITRRGSGPPAAYASQEVGNHDTLRSRAGVSGSWQWLDYALGFYHLESNGQSINDGTNQDAASARFGVTLPWGNTRVGAAVRYNKTDSGLPIEFVGIPSPIVPTIDPNTRQESETYTATLDVRTRPVTWWEGQLRASRYENNQAFIDPPDPFACPPATFGPPCDFPGRFRVSRTEVEGLSHFHLGTWSTSTFGVEWRDEDANVQGSSAFSPHTETVSGLFEQKFRFFDRLFMSAGVRVEDNSAFGRSTTERGSLAYHVKEWGTRLRGSAGSGFRAPTFNDLFFPGFSNASLTPEKSFSWDVGVDQKLWRNRVRLGFTYFDNRFSDLIICCTPLPVFPFATTANVGRARTTGIEFVSEVDVLDNLVAAVNYTYTDTENLLTDRPLPREPRHRWNVRLTWEPVRRLSLFTAVHVVTRQFDTLGNVYNTGHTRVDVGGTYRLVNRYAFLKALDLTARIQNLLDEGYAEVRGFPALGLQALVGFRASF